MKRNDTLWKGILENVYEDFLRFFFKDADKLFDIEKGFQFLDKELEQLFPADDLESPKFVDKLVKVFTKTKQTNGSLSTSKFRVMTTATLLSECYLFLSHS